MNRPNKLHLGQFPTPMHRLDNMSRVLGRNIYIKRDDMTGVSTGGNKVRKLEYLLYDAKEKGADYVLTTGGAQSNHAMLTAACCNKIGIKAILVLKQRGVQGRVGNLLINELLGADVRFVDTDSYDDVYKEMDRIADELRAAGHNPYLVPVGGSVPLGSIADVSVVMSPQTITRYNQSRQVTISGDAADGDTSAMAKSIRAILAGYTLPGGYTAELAGGYTEMMENFSDLGLALIVSVGLVYFVLASQFESFVMPVIIMMILPIAFAGALFALPLTGKDLSMISLVSLIMLAGTVVNASIVLVDYIKQRRDRGETREEAILHACPLRIRPVLMTTLTTILALVPTALGMTGKMNEMMSDMGTTMIAGMLVSTVITLLFTPVYYCVIDDLTHRRERRKAKKLAAAQSEP